MISQLTGNVAYRGTDNIILLVGGVGYKVAATLDTISNLVEHTEATLWTHLAVRENSLDLYGFLSRDELRFFELLLSVSGIGPKSALNIIGIADIRTLRGAIAAGDVTHLTKVSGIGKKTAEKIVLELREKMGTADLEMSSSHKADADALEALHALGYSLSEARETLKLVPREVEGSNERLREALRLLGK